MTRLPGDGDALIPPASAESFLEPDGGRVRVLRSTAEPEDPSRLPLLVIHGGNTDSTAISWYETFAALGAERPVIGVDLPEFGATTGLEPLGGPDAMADFVACAAGPSVRNRLREPVRRAQLEAGDRFFTELRRFLAQIT